MPDDGVIVEETVLLISTVDDHVDGAFYRRDVLRRERGLLWIDDLYHPWAPLVSVMSMLRGSRAHARKSPNGILIKKCRVLISQAR